MGEENEEEEGTGNNVLNIEQDKGEDQINNQKSDLDKNLTPCDLKEGVNDEDQQIYQDRGDSVPQEAEDEVLDSARSNQAVLSKDKKVDESKVENQSDHQEMEISKPEGVLDFEENQDRLEMPDGGREQQELYSFKQPQSRAEDTEFSSLRQP